MTLLPNKHIPTNRSLVGIGALVLGRLERPTNVSRLWESVKDEQEVANFGSFVLSLDYLFAVGAIDYERGLLIRSHTMISSVRSNMPSFKAVEFTPGFNVILADRTKESMRGDSRNGLGKTTLFEIVHFCLGAGTRRNRGLLAAPLKGWTFTLELQMEDRSLAVTRSTDKPNRVQLQGDVDDLADVGEHQNGGLAVRIADWNTFLGEQLFGLSPEEHLPKYQPTFRSLFSYLVRRDRDAFSSPFNHHRRQSEWDKQVNNAFLLDLAWQHASELQELKDNENALNGLRRAARDGLLQGLIGNLGNLEAERTRLDTEIRQQSGTLQSFRVHPQYAEIEEEVNELTSRIQQMLNANITDGRLVDLYSFLFRRRPRSRHRRTPRSLSRGRRYDARHGAAPSRGSTGFSSSNRGQPASVPTVRNPKDRERQKPAWL